VGLPGLLRETWERYRVPIAITECHIGCTREEQMRWLGEVWCNANVARDDGIDVRAVTSWALLGSYDWNSLVTLESDHYEPGAFDARGTEPRATALAAMVRALATEGEYGHPVLDTPGWWRRGAEGVAGARPILIADPGGHAGAEIAAVCVGRGLAHVLLDRERLDVHSMESVRAALDAHRPWSVIAGIGYAAALADECSRRGLTLTSHDPRASDVNATLDQLLDDDCSLVVGAAIEAGSDLVSS
jgi:dTDP-4-dehydrorhamnose reductase